MFLHDLEVHGAHVQGADRCIFASSMFRTHSWAKVDTDENTLAYTKGLDLWRNLLANTESAN